MFKNLTKKGAYFSLKEEDLLTLPLPTGEENNITPLKKSLL
jgi:hypothetical protein